MCDPHCPSDFCRCTLFLNGHSRCRRRLHARSRVAHCTYEHEGTEEIPEISNEMGCNHTLDIHISKAIPGREFLPPYNGLKWTW